MGISIRAATQDDFPAIADLDSASFGVHYTEAELTDVHALLDLDRFLVAVDGDLVVGVTGDFPFTMTVPGGRLAVPGVTWVSVDVTYRRRGILSQLMRAQLGAYRDAGVPAAILTASEGGIYPRFGYGAASYVHRTVIPRRDVELAVPGQPGAVRRASPAQARAAMPKIHDRWRAQTPGALDRSEAWWTYLCLDRQAERNGMSALFYLVHEDGYVAYRVRDEIRDGQARHACWIVDYVVASPQAHADLWTVLLGLDLMETVESHQIPGDDPLQYMVNDARLIRTERVRDGVWVRPLDVAGMLAARTYAIEVDTVIEVRDAMFGDGRYLLTGGPETAVSQPTDATAGVTIDAASLGAVYLGGVRLEELARGGRVSGDARAIAQLDRALQADRLPSHGTGF